MNYLDFMPLEHRLGGQIHVPTGGVFTQWATGGFNDYWGTPAQFEAGTATPELFAVEVVDGRAWLTLLGFQQVEPPHNIWDLRTIQANLYLSGKKQLLSIPKRGHVYAPISFEPCSVEIWGIIEEQNPFYWRAWYTGPFLTANPFRDSVQAIEQREVWWDRTGGWIRGGPTPKNAVPFIPGTSIPQDISTESAWFQRIGYASGPAFTIGTINNGVAKVDAALMHLWAW